MQNAPKKSSYLTILKYIVQFFLLSKFYGVEGSG